jgi:hypothetical protein
MKLLSTVAATVMILSLSATAQEEELLKFFNPSQPCIPVQLALESAKEYGEKLLFTATGTQIYMEVPFQGATMFFVNQETGTWSFIHAFEDGYACLITSGIGFTPYAGPQ